MTADYVRLVVPAMTEGGTLPVLKHFPGYGNNADTHTGIAVDQRPMETFKTADLLPFKAGIEAWTPFVLVSHNIVNCMDPELPASLSLPFTKFCGKNAALTASPSPTIWRWTP